uniref:Uncharacterized protein n=1 Tax=Setaria italica TaxID=4555 RepID=K3Z2N3_SETIT
MREMIGTIEERKRMAAPFLSPRGHRRRGQASISIVFRYRDR